MSLNACSLANKLAKHSPYKVTSLLTSRLAKLENDFVMLKRRHKLHKQDHYHLLLGEK